MILYSSWFEIQSQNLQSFIQWKRIGWLVNRSGFGFQSTRCNLLCKTFGQRTSFKACQQLFGFLRWQVSLHFHAKQIRISIGHKCLDLTLKYQLFKNVIVTKLNSLSKYYVTFWNYDSYILVNYSIAFHVILMPK